MGENPLPQPPRCLDKNIIAMLSSHTFNVEPPHLRDPKKTCFIGLFAGFVKHCHLLLNLKQTTCPRCRVLPALMVLGPHLCRPPVGSWPLPLGRSPPSCGRLPGHRGVPTTAVPLQTAGRPGCQDGTPMVNAGVNDGYRGNGAF